MKGEVVPISSIAEKVNVDQETLKKRLKKLDKRIGGGLLVRFAEGGRLYVDKEILRHHVPAYVREEGEEVEPIRVVLRGVEEIRAEVALLREDVSVIRRAAEGTA